MSSLFLQWWFASPSSSRATQPVCGKGDGSDDDHALDGVLERTGDALQIQPREQCLQSEGTGHRGHDRSTAATEHDTAQHAGGDRVELEACADLGRNPAEAPEQN